MKAILYYKYVEVDNPEKFKDEQLELCKFLELKGRVFIGKEGINGTLSGSIENIEKYKNYLKRNPLFSDIMFKENEANEHVFEKLFIRLRKEIVNFSKEVDLKNIGNKIKPKEFKELIESGSDIVILDVRNSYETQVGRFKGAIDLGIENFRDFPNKIDSIKHLKNKKIVMYCTGGVRCEKASAFLIENGFRDVSQLEGGIMNYSKEVPNSYFDGKCFVFDNRMSVGINNGGAYNVISNCEICEKPSDRIIDCCNNDCNKIFIEFWLF